MERAEDKGWSDVLQVNRHDPRKSFIRTVAQRRPAGWLTRGEGACGNYLLGQAGKDVHAGYGEQWLKTLKAAIEIIPNALKPQFVPLKMAQVQLVDR
jgi:hypothetical protein